MSDKDTGMTKDRMVVTIFVLLLTIALVGLRATGQ